MRKNSKYVPITEDPATLRSNLIAVFEDINNDVVTTEKGAVMSRTLNYITKSYEVQVRQEIAIKKGLLPTAQNSTK